MWLLLDSLWEVCTGENSIKMDVAHISLCVSLGQIFDCQREKSDMGRRWTKKEVFSLLAVG